ncbi:MAG: 3-dehydroquinate synthase [Acidobacteria bacterium]|nr:3-dehydroquinate synthase [Acidobacteriota bacterium]
MGLATGFYEAAIGSGLLGSAGLQTRRWLGNTARRAAIISDSNVLPLYGEAIRESFRDARFETSVGAVSAGERYKSLKSLEQTLSFLSQSRLSRTDVIIALGGGVVGDLAGLAAAVYLRGMPFIQIPTTLLAMVDSSVGGKTGVNTKFGKNLVGAFHSPAGVVIDTDVLTTLPRREMTAGLCEMIKHAALSGKPLFRQTSAYLDRRDELGSLIAENVQFKASIVAGDERESTARRDARSRKILNLGHTFAHAIEKVTSFRRFRHGEAVGHGLLFAAELSKSLAMLDETSVNLLYDVVHRAGKLPPLDGINSQEVFDAFAADKKNIGGSLQWVLLKGIGKPVIVGQNEIPTTKIKSVLKAFLKQRA